MAYIIYLGWHLFLRDLKVRYRRTLLGYFWSVVPAFTLLAAAGILLAGNKGAGTVTRSSLNLLAGLLVFQLFIESFMSPQQTVRRHRSLFMRHPLPPGSLLATASFAVFYQLLLRLPLFVLLAFAMKTPFSFNLIQAAFSLLLLTALGVAAGSMLAPAAIVLWDVRYGTVLIQPLFFLLTPIIYAPPERGFLGLVNALNPLTYLVLGTRDWLLTGSSTYAMETACLAFPVAIFFMLAALFFHRSLGIAAQNL